MDDKRRDLIAAGLCLGDIVLAQAALFKDLPSYVEGLDAERLIHDAGTLQSAREEIQALIGGEEDLDSLPPPLVKKILDTAIEKGKFLSATRCLELLGERQAYVGRFVAGAGEKLKAGDHAGAARDIVIASNLESEAGFPLFQYTGPELHANCTHAPGECVTRLPLDDAVSKALYYLLEGERVMEFASTLGGAEKKSLLPHVAAERDPHLGEFYAGFAKAHAALGDLESGRLEDLRRDLSRAASVASALAKSLEGPGLGDESAAMALDRAARVSHGLLKDFEGVDALVDELQLRRIRRRIDNLMQSESDLKSAAEALGGAGDPAAITSALSLIAEFQDKGLVDRVGEIERGLVDLQVGLLGRPVHSQEHWQYLRELAFKYPASPLMCCVRRLNDRFMVIPMWESGITALLREHIDRGGMQA